MAKWQFGLGALLAAMPLVCVLAAVWRLQPASPLRWYHVLAIWIDAGLVGALVGRYLDPRVGPRSWAMVWVVAALAWTVSAVSAVKNARPAPQATPAAPPSPPPPHAPQ